MVKVQEKVTLIQSYTSTHQKSSNFLNNIYTKNYTPNEWRNAAVIAIFKKGDRGDPKNYREISIFSL